VQVPDEPVPGVGPEGQAEPHRDPDDGDDRDREQVHGDHVQHVTVRFEPAVEEREADGHEQD
jgi:hypothetical protein